MSVAEQIKQKLEAALAPQRLEVVNESDKHIGHAGDDGSGESHFRIKIVSDKFTGCGRVRRHRMVYEALSTEIKDLIHAISIEASAPGESYPL